MRAVPPSALAVLQAAVVADPSDVSAYLVYGDLLQAAGDPRGELMALQHALVTAPSDQWPPIRLAIRGLLERRRHALLGPLANIQAVRVKWHMGFIRSAHVSSNRALPLLLALPSARLIEELSVAWVGDDDAVFDVLAANARPTLRRLTVGSERDDLGRPGDVEPLCAAFPNLAVLELHAWKLRLGQLHLPRLERLAVWGQAAADAHVIDSIVAADWPALRSIRVAMSLRPDTLVHGLRAPNLQHLALLHTRRTDSLLRAVHTAPLGALSTLDLRNGELGAAGARYLLAHAEDFSRLQRLDLAMNTIPYRSREALRRLPFVNLGRQRA